MVFKKWGMEQMEQFVASGNDLWGVIGQGIIYVNLLDDNTLFTPLAEINAVRDQISNMSSEIQDEPDVVIRIRKLAQLYDYLKQHSDWGSYSFEQLLQYQRVINQEAIKSVELFLTGAITPFQKELAYYTLAKIPIRLEQPELAFRYYNALKREFPQSILLKYFSADDVRKLNDNRRLAQIKKMPKSREEEKLWLLGNFFHDNVPYSENLPDYRLSHQYLEDLLKRYPKSKWADNAAYIIITDSELTHEDGDYTRPNACIKKYQDFLKKYPDSEEAPRAKYDIADHCFLSADQGGGFTDPQIFGYLSIAKKLCGEILQSKTDAGTKENTSSLLKRINQLLESHPWALEMKPVSKCYKIGDPIIIAFKLKNMSNTVRKITIYKNLPNFGVRILREVNGSETQRDSVVMAIKVFPNQPRKTVINIPAKGGEYNEQIVLQKMMVGPESGYVRYKITEPGTYKLTGFCNHSVIKLLETKELRIVVTK
jgi:tetratricopeptide (TPR) repeat protein